MIIIITITSYYYFTFILSASYINRFSQRYTYIENKISYLAKYRFNFDQIANLRIENLYCGF